jgi:G:T-mismatch repair DNA endonuclease (very short patch repair protein)
VYVPRVGRCGLPAIQIPSNNSCRTPRNRRYQAKNWTDTVQRAARRDRPNKRGIAREFDVTVIWACGRGRGVARENSFEDGR